MKNIKLIGTKHLKEAFLKEINDKGWKPIASATNNSIINDVVVIDVYPETKVYTCNKSAIRISYNLPANWDKALQEFEEPTPVQDEYTIMSFRETEKNHREDIRVFKLQENGNYWTGDNRDIRTCGLKQMLHRVSETKNFIIESVRRNSDGVMFKIGDMLKYHNEGPITIIEVMDNAAQNIWLGTRSGGVGLLHAALDKAVPVEKHWEILKFKADVYIWHKLKNGNYTTEGEGSTSWTLQEMIDDGNSFTYSMANGSMFIHKVKNLLTGDIYTVGDYVQPLEAYTLPEIIEEIVLGAHDNILVKTHAYRVHGIDLRKIKKVDKPKPLFVTEDGVKLYKETDEYWSYLPRNKLYDKTPNKLLVMPKVVRSGLYTDWKVFSSEATMWDHIYKTEQLLTVQDIIEMNNGYSTSIVRAAQEKVKNRLK